MPRGFLAPRMPKDQVGALGLQWAIFFSCLITHIGTQDDPELWCYTDYETEVVCLWDVTNATDCAREFRLQAWSDNGCKWDCAPEIRRTPESASPNCACVIPREKCREARFTVSLFTRTNKSTEHTFYLSDIVKPRPLRNLTVTKTKKRSFVLAWEKSYDNSCVLHDLKVVCQIQLSFEGQRKPNLKSVLEKTEHYEIFTDQLFPGKNYTARIRYRLDNWGGFWSDWSSPCHWFNDFEPEPTGQLWWFVLLLCFLTMILISTCYCCLISLKRQWWDQIPNPKIAGDLGKKPRPVPWQVHPAGEEWKVPLCAPSQERQLSFVDTLPQDGAAFPAGPNKPAKMVPGSRLESKWEGILTPEATSVEASLTIGSPVTVPDPRTPHVEEEGSCVPQNDPLLALFKELLKGGDGSEDAAEPPEPVRKESPPVWAPEPALGGLCLLGGTPRKSPGGSSESDYRNMSVAVSSRAESPSLEQRQGDDDQSSSSSQYKLLTFPQPWPSAPYRAVVEKIASQQAEGQVPSWAATPQQPSCYKSFSSLVGRPTTSSPQPWGEQGDFSGVQQEASSWNAPGVPCTAESWLPGYQPLRLASRGDSSCLCVASPYQPLVEVFQNVPKGGPLLEAAPREGEAWGAWEEPLAFAFRQCMEEEEDDDSGQDDVWQRKECFLPQVPVASL